MERRSLGVGLAITIAQLGVLSAAPPPNDNFADRIDLGNGATVTEMGTNVEATVEPGETLAPFGDRTGTVWWSWTAPQSGWYRFDTAGSSFDDFTDTIIAIGTGNSLASYDELVFNDEVWEPSPANSAALLEVSSGTTYAIAVGGWNGSEGDIVMNISPADAPTISITSVSVMPGSVDVSASEQLVAIEIDVTSVADLSNLDITLESPSGQSTANTFLSADDRISGDLRSGQYRIEMTVPRYVEPGEHLLSIRLGDSDGNSVAYGFNYSSFVETPDSFRIDVANTGPVDDAAPVLVNLSLSPDPIDITTGGDLTLTFEVSDALAGVSGGSFNIYDSSGEWFTGNAFGTNSLVSGDPSSGTFEVTASLPQGPRGTYRLEIQIFDTLGNGVTYGGDPVYDGAPFPAGLPDSFEANNTSAGYPEWAVASTLAGAGAAPSADPDGDGVTNLLEYAFGMNPRVYDAKPVASNGTSGLPAVPDAALFNQLQIRYIVRRDAPDLTYLVETSDDGEIFNSAIGGTSTTRVGDFNRLTRSGLGLDGAGFARVRVIYLPPPVP